MQSRPIPPPPARQSFAPDATPATADSPERRDWELALARRARSAAKVTRRAARPRSPYASSGMGSWASR